MLNYLLFFIVVVFLETHVGAGKYTHGVAHTLKETLFPDMAGDNIGFPGGRVPKRLSGWNNVYEFFSDSVAKHFNNPKIGDTLKYLTFFSTSRWSTTARMEKANE